MKEIKLTQGRVALVDDQDYEYLSKFKWCAQIYRNWAYAARAIKSPDGKRRLQLMHRLILNPPQGMDVDHISGDTMDNRRSNLRVATRQQNIGNSKVYSTNTTGFKGVSRIGGGKFVSAIRFNGKRFWLGTFTDIESAHEAYKISARKFFGEFASNRTTFTQP